MSYASQFDHTEFDGAMKAFAQAAEPLKLLEAAERLRPLAERYRAGATTLLFVGEIKKGKSSCVNALLNCAGLVPTGIDVTTSTVFKVVHGSERRYRVFFQLDDPEDPGSSRPEPRDIGPHEVAQYGTEAGNPGNAKRVDFIAVEHPHPLLAAGISIIDLPGLGGMYREHSLLTLRYLERADAVVFVVDSTEQVLGRKEVETLQRLGKGAHRIVFVQTKTDKVGEDKLRAWQDYNMRTIQDKLGIAAKELRYFPLSSKLKLEADRLDAPELLTESGFPAFAAYLAEELLPARRDALAQPLAEAMEAELLAARRAVEETLSIVGAESAEEVRRLEGCFRDAQERHAEWQRRRYPAMIEAFDDGFSAAMRRASERIARELDPSPYGPVVGHVMANLEKSSMSAAELASMQDEIAEMLVEACSDKMRDGSAQFDEAVRSAYAEVAVEIGKQLLPVEGTIASPVVPLGFASGGVQTHGGLFEKMRTGFYAGSFGSMAGGAAGMVLATLFPPLGLAMIVGSVLGGIFGAFRGVGDLRNRERQAVLEQYRRVLGSVTARIQQEASRALHHHADDTKKAMRRNLRDAVEQRDKELRAAVAEAQQQRHRSQTETAERLKALRQPMGELDRLLGLLRRAVIRLAAA